MKFKKETLGSSPEPDKGSLYNIHAPASVFVSCDCQLFQTYSPQKPFDLSKPNFMWSVLGKGNRSLYKWSRSNDQDGRQAYLWLKPLKSPEPKVL